MSLCIIFDTETTGLTLHPDAAPHKQPKIIEFGGVLLDTRDGSIVHEFNKLINPGEAITEEITKITGITDAMVANEPQFPAHFPFIKELFAQASSVCAHNLPFDRAVLFGELTRHQLDCPWPRKERCTMNMYNPLYGYNPKLVNLYQDVMGKVHEQTHRAVEDVHMMVQIIQKERLWTLL